MDINTWMYKWSIPAEAVRELRELSAPSPTDTYGPGPAYTEAAVTQKIRLRASAMGIRLWRNNVGAVTTEDNRFIRFGLANESKKMNTLLKSADLIGITPYVVKRCDIGRTLGVFTSIEVKEQGWIYSGATNREIAQREWIQAIRQFGGFATFGTDAGCLDQLT